MNASVTSLNFGAGGGGAGMAFTASCTRALIIWVSVPASSANAVVTLFWSLIIRACREFNGCARTGEATIGKRQGRRQVRETSLALP